MRKATELSYQERILRVQLHIQNNLDQTPNLDELAGVACLSPYHFHRIFRGMVGESVAGYARRLRLEGAARQVRNGQRSLTEIALACGYASSEAFSRAFKSQFGLGPRAARQAAIDGNGDPLASASPGPHPPGPEVRSPMQVTRVHRKPIRVAFVRHVGPYSECGAAWDRLLTRLGAEGWLGPNIEHIGLCHDDPHVTETQHVRYDACVTVDESFRPSGEIGAQKIEGGFYAMTTHHGPYEQLNEAYLELIGRWVPQRGVELRSQPCLEIYLNSPENTEPEELLTDIYLPLEA